jgi:hypothetical protein
VPPLPALLLLELEKLLQPLLLLLPLLLVLGLRLALWLLCQYISIKKTQPTIAFYDVRLTHLRLELGRRLLRLPLLPPQGLVQLLLLLFDVTTKCTE